MADEAVEHELCGNCKREIPQSNYVMHTAHCARNITLRKTCNEPIPRIKYEEHSKKCSSKQKTPEPPKTNLEKSTYFQSRKEVEDKKRVERRERYLERHEKFLTDESSKKLGFTTKIGELKGNEAVSMGTGAVKKKVNGSAPKKTTGMMPCRYCDLELSKTELEEHETYCGSRTDKCMECGELVMFKYKQMHLDTNHGFLKLKDEPGPKPSWESTSEKKNSPPRRRRFEPTIYTDFSQFDPTDYLPSNYRIPKPKIEKGESYKEISRRLDCKTEYIRNLLHDSASITVPLRHSGAVPRNHFNHNKGPAPQPPSRRRNPPTELCIPCEFCDTPIPHEELILHESGCRPDLFARPARRSLDLDYYECDLARAPEPPRRQRAAAQRVETLIPCEFCDEPVPQDVLIEHQTGCRPDLARKGATKEDVATPEVELPCEFCEDMFPASKLDRHQATCI